ncbi:hypothetical protein JOC85_000147 [Bacillus mesophilus]|uniref:Flagellar hook-length control protein FliK n=1 Tax=Bacillus mesophilus TaxID=1808955 RepID=A0A6M0Q249_9BACI|nr:hypothetical protein [Bacillus mesophilus]MBM7659380.1 hypothetical protein [Bacillus mesophilus]NEY70252.1 hypothetical protein [Bacillus mesophilus]
MNPTQIIHSMLNSDRVQQASTLSVRPGQIINGKVQKIFPNNIAIVQLGTMRLHAQVEAAIELNERYWFEAKHDKNGELYLKVIDQKMGGHLVGKESTVSLLGQFQLPETKLNRQLLQLLQSVNLSFTKEQLTKAALWLNETSNPTSGLKAIEWMLQKELPFTNQTFKSLVAFLNPASISSQLTDVKNMLNNARIPSSDSVVQLKSYLSSILEGSSQMNGKKALELTIDQWLSPKGSKQTQDAAFRILQSLHVISKSLTQEEAISTFQKLDQRQVGSEAARLDVNTRAQITNEIIKSLTTSQVNKLESSLIGLAGSISSETPTEDALLIKQLVNYKGTSFDNGLEVKQLFKQMVQLLGLEHEKEFSALIRNNIENPEKLESLKSLLLTVMNELGATGKDLEPLLNRITGLQILSQEVNGPLQQLYMQFPLSLGSKLSDVTLQWSGQKKENGQIDPNFCRILFYLDLENINETIIDMQVQNRVINISIINDTDGLESSVAPNQTLLKEQLTALNYVLSSVKVNKSAEKERLPQPFDAINSQRKQSYQGVDIKI